MVYACSMAQPLISPGPPRHRDEHDQSVTLRGATWADYQRHLELRGDKAVPRITYLEGMLELMSPSRLHESEKSMIGCLVEAWCFEQGVDISPYGSWTLKSQAADAGAEPDECYVVGDDPDPALPDLAIEVVRTSGGLSKLEVYCKLQVGEVWIYRQGAFTLHALRGERYVSITASEILPGIDLGLLSRYIDISPMTRAVREYRQALRSRKL